jgi:hypothetical protein
MQPPFHRETLSAFSKSGLFSPRLRFYRAGRLQWPIERFIFWFVYPRSINLICDTALVYGFGYELETIDAPVIEQVVKDKGGMGINAGTENKAGASSGSIEQEIDKTAMVRLQKLEDTIQFMQRQVDSMMDIMEDLEVSSKTFKKDTDRKLERLLLLERKRNDKLLVAYSQLKVKYHNLLKAWKNKVK